MGLRLWPAPTHHRLEMPSITLRPSCVVNCIPSAATNTRGSLRKARLGVKGSQWLSMLKSLKAMGYSLRVPILLPSAQGAEDLGQQRAARADRVAPDLLLLLADHEIQAVQRLARDVVVHGGVLGPVQA